MENYIDAELIVNDIEIELALTSNNFQLDAELYTGGGTFDHTRLNNRNAINQHPISSITNLTETLAQKVDLANTIVINCGGASAT